MIEGSLRMAVLGVEHYHANFWTRAFQQSEAVEIAGVWDADAVRAAEFAGRHGLRAWADRDALVAQADAVAICSATSDHPELVEAAARQGKAVLCEKPLGATIADCLQIRDLVARSGIPFMQSFPKRFDPVNHEVKQLVESGAIGRILLCRVRHGHSHGFSEEFRSAWFVDPARSGGGTLLDEGVHAADFLRFLFGEPHAVSATISNQVLGLAVEDTAVATFRYENGLIAEVATSWCFAAADTSVEIYGTEGTILLGGVDLASRPTRDSEFLRVFRQDETGGRWSASPTVPYFKTGIFHEHVAWAFVAALRAGGPMPVGVEDGLRASLIVDAAYRSARASSLPINYV